MTESILPPYFLREKDIKQLIDAPTPEIVIPYQFIDGDNYFTHTIISITNGVVVCMVFDPTQHRWIEHSRYNLTHDPLTHWVSPWVGDVLFRGNDATIAKTIRDQLALIFNRFYRHGSFQVPPMDGSTPPPLAEKNPSCRCQSSESDRRLGQMSSDNFDHYRAVCPHCERCHGLYEDGEFISRKTLFAEEWLFAISSEKLVSRIINSPSNDLYYLISPDQTVTRVERAVDVMCHIAYHDTYSSISFDPESHIALIQIKDGIVTGMIVWGPQFGLDILRLLFVREPYRRQGVAQTLCKEWKDRFFDGTTYYLDDPNPKSLSLHRKLGDLQDGSSPQAVKTYMLHPRNLQLGNDIFWKRLQHYYGLSRE